SDKYSPGQSVKFGILVKDKNNKPVPNTSVCVSVVDEAAFAVENQIADPLGNIYSKYFYPIINTYASYVQHDFSGSGLAEKGGEGGSDYIRKNFLDTASFLTGTTGEDGRCSLTFALPDNLTTWRVTSLALTDGVYAGTNKVLIKTTKPFFADLIVNSVFLKGDDLSATVRGYGTALKDGDKISYVAELQLPDKTKKSFTGSGTPGSYLNLNFGKGEAGSYTLTVKATSGGNTDSLQKSFRVLNGALEVPITKTFDLSKGIDISALRSPVTLSFFDRSRSLYMECLQDLAAGSGVRADVRASRDIAKKLLKDKYGDTLPYYFSSEDEDKAEPGSLQGNNGGARLFAYSGEQADLTAMLCAAAPEYMNTELAAAYLEGVINNKFSQPEDVAASYMGLAAMHKPVLLDVKYLLENDAALNLQEKLYLTAALAYIGDLDSAKVSYDKLLSGRLGHNDPWVFVCGSENKGADMECTTLATITAMALGEDDTEPMMRYIVENSSDSVETCLEKLMYIRNYSPAETGKSSFSYFENGKKKIVTLENNQAVMLSLTADELKSASFKTVSGNVGVCASFIGSPDEIT
ncbi:MAG: alpha-2-macroglobulin family protein, partial [Bacillota bacterium]|nr:alpha-2-macroglobulin family protein [Bacillota bacterium]